MKRINSLKWVALTAVLWAGQANAQCPDDQAIFVFDQSGSMISNGVNGDPKWEEGLEWAESHLATLPSGTEVAIVGFGNTTTGGSPYSYYDTEFSDGLVSDDDDAALLAQMASTAQPSNAYLSPIAGSACDALEDVFTGNTACAFETSRNVYLITDGLENSTPTNHGCHSTTSSSTDFDEDLADQGFGLTPNSWEWKVANMAWTGNPLVTALPPVEPPLVIPRPVVSVALLFDFQNSLSAGEGAEGQIAGANLQSLNSSASAFYGGLAEVTFGSYFESKTVGGTPTVLPVVGDTDPAPTYSCVNAADYNRVLEAYGLQVTDNDPTFSGEDLAMRDVNNDLVIDILDYYLVIQNYGTCAS